MLRMDSMSPPAMGCTALREGVAAVSGRLPAKASRDSSSPGGTAARARPVKGAGGGARFQEQSTRPPRVHAGLIWHEERPISGATGDEGPPKPHHARPVLIAERRQRPAFTKGPEVPRPHRTSLAHERHGTASRERLFLPHAYYVFAWETARDTEEQAARESAGLPQASLAWIPPDGITVGLA